MVEIAASLFVLLIVGVPVLLLIERSGIGNAIAWLLEKLFAPLEWMLAGLGWLLTGSRDWNTKP